eukprot:scaffold123813_cov27-Tisochrysis_lutea.AAC.1
MAAVADGLRSTLPQPQRDRDGFSVTVGAATPNPKPGDHTLAKGSNGGIRFTTTHLRYVRRILGCHRGGQREMSEIARRWSSFGRPAALALVVG